MEKVILASASPRRKELLELIGIPFLCHPAKGEEVTNAIEPAEVVKELARQKALEVSANYPAGIILGADTVVAFQGEILGKPRDRQHALEMITKLQGQTHQVYTGVCLLRIRQGKIADSIVFAEETQVEMYPMSRSEIDRYIHSGEGDDKAGAYAIQGKCAVYIKGIVGDYYNVVGLPVARVYQSLINWSD